MGHIQMKCTFMLTIILTIFMLFTAGCKDSPVQPKEAVTITVDDVSCTEAWLNIKTENIQLPAEGTLTAEGVTKQISLNKADTTVYIDSLQPNKSYSFSFTVSSTTAKVEAKTMDTTSHSFTWQSFDFGESMSNIINDVAVIDENNIWAVGEIYLRDSTGQIDPQLYNLARWNGTEWKLERVYFHASSGNTFLVPIKTIFAFNSNDIILGMDQLTRWDGSRFKEIEIPTTTFHSWINKIWGSSDNDLYVVGNEGNIAHYNGTSWTKIESGTTLNINDIYGAYNNKTNKYEILAVASNILQNYDKEVLNIEGNKVTKLNNVEAEYITLCSVWLIPERKYFVTGAGIYKKNNLNDPVWDDSIREISNYYTDRIRGTGFNNIFTSGAYGEVLHFNGISWKDLTGQTSLSNGEYYSLDVKSSLVCLAGFNGSKAIVTVGIRN